MDKFFTKLLGKSSREIGVGMFGLNNAGKTSLLYQLIDNFDHTKILPTIGFNVETIKFGKFLIKIWDVGGGRRKNRALWWHYNGKTTKAIIFVIDAADSQKFSLATRELKWLWQRPELSKAVFLIFLNKQDLSTAVKSKKIIKILDLKNSPIHHPWIVQECCALSGEGIREGLEKLVQLLHESKKKRKCLIKM